MRLLRWALGGLVLGALAGLVVFLIILLMPSNTPDNADGAGVYMTLLLIAAVFATMGGVAGCLIGFVAGGMYQVAVGTRSQARNWSERPPATRKVHQRFDDLLD